MAAYAGWIEARVIVVAASQALARRCRGADLGADVKILVRLARSDRLGPWRKTSAQLDREIAESLAARQISDRRIAHLIANGEDVRNTPAWRDAMSEQRMINFMTPLKRKPARDDRELVTITWYAVPNAHKARGGYMPVYELDGKVRGHTYGRGYPKAEAEAEAEAMAHKEAERYTGDWNVVVKKGRAS